MYGDKIRLNAYHLLLSLGHPSSKIGDYIGPREISSAPIIPPCYGSGQDKAPKIEEEYKEA